jgi:hypothetical protein
MIKSKEEITVSVKAPFAEMIPLGISLIAVLGLTASNCLSR